MDMDISTGTYSDLEEDTVSFTDLNISQLTYKIMKGVNTLLVTTPTCDHTIDFLQGAYHHNKVKTYKHVIVNDNFHIHNNIGSGNGNLLIMYVNTLTEEHVKDIIALILYYSDIIKCIYLIPTEHNQLVSIPRHPARCQVHQFIPSDTEPIFDSEQDIINKAIQDTKGLIPLIDQCMITEILQKTAWFILQNMLIHGKVYGLVFYKSLSNIILSKYRYRECPTTDIKKINFSGDYLSGELFTNSPKDLFSTCIMELNDLANRVFSKSSMKKRSHLIENKKNPVKTDIRRTHTRTEKDLMEKLSSVLYLASVLLEDLDVPIHLKNKDIWKLPNVYRRLKYTDP
ncbi:hypothetical protein [Salmon gill poxvirus]